MDNIYGDGVSHELLGNAASIKQLLESLAQSERELKNQVTLFSAFLDALPNPIFVKDNNAVFIACNAAYEKAFGIAREEFVGKTVMDLDYLPELSRHTFQKADLELLRERGETREEIELAFGDGCVRTVLYQRKTFELGDGQGGMLGLIVDISQRKRAEKLESFRSSILEMLAGGEELRPILMAIVQGVETLCPDMMCSILLADDEGQYLGNRVATSLPESYTRALGRVAIGHNSRPCGIAACTGQRVIVENIASHPNWAGACSVAIGAGLVSCWSQPIKAGSGDILGTFAIYHRRSAIPIDTEIELIEHTARLASIAIEKTRAEHTIRELAYYDALTALPNRRMLNEHLLETLAAGQNTGEYGALMLLDLDNFKPLNDQYGHMVGDQLLVEVARRLSRSVRHTDLVARLGGDEFVVVLDSLGGCAEAAELVTLEIAEAVRKSVVEPFRLVVDSDQGELEWVSHTCSASIGVTLFSGVQECKSEVLRQADQAMYQAKKSGRNSICLFESVE
ncbi:diguanylate cyclase domain-containing protein [Marinobacterium maritimum]